MNFKRKEVKSYKDAVAIIGMGCRFPGGSNNVEDFWELLKDGVDAISIIPDNRWDEKSFYNKNRKYKGKTVSRYGGFLDNIDEFDPKFFGITPREAPFIDPQQRLLLETSWEAMEDAGMVVKNYSGKDVGVFMGAFTLDYKILQFGNNNYDLIDVHTATGSMMSMIANRISYQYDFRGPSLTIDTACSSSLVSIHTACRSILGGECSMALAGGVLLNIAPQYTIAESQGGFLSIDGKCKTLDASANGYVRGEGVGVIILKPLKDALRDNDHIYSVVLGSAVNQDGNTSSITVPNTEAQVDVIRSACHKASVKPSDIQYVEMHGTGTSVGDPLEAAAIGKVMAEGRQDEKPCVIGSLKTNIGHTESAAGVASVIKTSLCLMNKTIPPHLNLNELNPKIELDKYKLHVSKTLEEWPKGEEVCIAGVNSFGFGGTNCHLVLGEAPINKKITNEEEEKYRVFPITARAKEGLVDLAIEYKILIEKNENINIYDLGYSMAKRRDLHAYRLGVIAKDKQGLIKELNNYINKHEDIKVIQGEKTKSNKDVVFVFTGMGPQWWKMGRELMEIEPIFKNEILHCDAEFQKYSNWSIYEALMTNQEDSLMGETYVAQVANFAVQVALVALWKAQGITPDAIVGHSAGEVAAFYTAKVLNFEDAIRVLYYRSHLQQKLKGKGIMMAVNINADKILEIIKDYKTIEIVAINSGEGITLAGDEEELQNISVYMTKNNIFNRFLSVDIPFHTRYMEEIKNEFLNGIQGISFKKPDVKLVSSVFGQYVTDILDESYWWKNIRQTVVFADALKELLLDDYECFLEIGPHPVLSHYIVQLANERNKKVITLSSLNRKLPEQEVFYSSFAELFANGYIDDFSYHYKNKGNYIKLPYYPWQRERYWIEDESGRKKRVGIFDHILLGHRMKVSEPAWEVELNERVIPFLSNHKIQGNKVFPAAGYMGMALQAAKEYYGDGYFELENIKFIKATFINPDKATKMQIYIDVENPSFKIYNSSNKEMVAKGSYKQKQNTGFKSNRTKDHYMMKISENDMNLFEDVYERFEKMGFGYYNHFRAIEKIYVGENCTVSKICLPKEVKEEMDEYIIHLGILDACFQGVIASEFVSEKKDIRLPVGVENFAVYSQLENEMWAVCHVNENNEEQSVSDITLYSINGNKIAEIKGFIVKVLSGVNKKPDVSIIDKWLYEFNWEEKELNTVDKKEEGQWIVLEDNKGIGKKVSNILMEHGEVVLRVEYSEEYLINSQKGIASVRENSLKDFVEIIRHCMKDRGIKGVLNFKNVELGINEKIDCEKIHEAGNKGTYTTINMVKAFVNEGIEKTKIWTFTLGGQEVIQGEESQILQRPAWGMARLLRNQENTGLWGGIVDFDPNSLESSIRCFVNDLLHGDDEDQLAYRNGNRYVGRLNHIHGLTKPFPVKLDEEGYYLITGAFGALGQLVIRWMADKGAKKLILVSRSKIPEKENWDNEDIDAKTLERIEFVKDLESQDIQVKCVALDMSDERVINKYFSNNQKLKSQIKGIIYAAGIVKDKLMIDMEKEVFDQVYDTKTVGSWVLHKQFENQELEFFVLFSSITAIVTATGQANYISANSFLDALADYRRKKGLPALSIAWGPWAEGMIKELNLEEVYKQKGMNPITDINGISVLERIIKQNIGYALVIEADWDKIIDSVPRSINPYLDHLKINGVENGSELLSDEESLKQFFDIYIDREEEEKRELLEERVIELVCKVLHLQVKDVSIESSLSELGMDSMMSTELKNRLTLGVGVNVTVVELLNNQSIGQLIKIVKTQVDTLLELDTLEDLVEDISESELQEIMGEIADKN